MTLVQRLVLLVVVALLPVLIAVAYGLSAIREAQDDALQNEAQRIARVIGAQHRDLIASAAELLPGLAALAPQAAERRDICDGLQAALPAPAKRWFDVMILDAKGIVRCSTQAGTVGSDRSAMPEVAQALTREAMARRTLEASSFSADPTLPMALHWRGTDAATQAGGQQGGAQGAVLLILRPGPAVTALMRATLPAAAAALIVDRGGRVLYAVPGLPPSRSGLAAPTLAELLPQVRPGSERGVWVDGTERVLAWDTLDPVGMPGVRVVVGVDGSEFRAELDNARRLMIAVVAATLAGATVTAAWGGVSFIRAPLNVLRDAALRWRDGDHSARVRLPGQSEIAALGRVFDEMAEATELSERRIREGAELLNALIESSADGIFVTDRDGRFLLVNSTFASLVGRPRAELIGLRATEVFATDMGPRVVETEQAVLETHSPQVCDLILPRGGTPDGAMRVLHTIYAPIMSLERAPGGGTTRIHGGSIVAAIAGIARDVTDERDAAAELRAAKERAEAADQSKTRFLAAASHDLRQPLQAALLFSSLIGEQAGPEIRKQAEQLRLVLDDLRAMLDSLFDVSRYDAQIVQPDIVPVFLQPLIEQVVAAAGGAARAKGVALVARPTDAWVLSDRALLGRMISNIVENAVRYTEAGSVTIACVAHGPLLRIEVRDTGRGIAPEDLTKIWQEFEQLHNPERDRRQGLGLGLAIVRRLSRLLGHPVSVTSTPGVGSTFAIDAPLAEAPAPVATVPAAEPTGGVPAEGGLAIVVEDDAALLAVLGLILEEHGWTVLSAGDDADLLPHISTTRAPPRIILTDYRLRNGRLGSDAIAAIRARVGRSIPAIILTGEIVDGDSTADGPLNDARRLGDVAVLRKPVGAADLVATVGRVAARADA